LPAPRTARVRLAAAALMALLCAGFLALGAWQVARLQWKTALIARVDQRVHAAPAEAPAPISWSRLNKDQDEYRHLRLNGHFIDELGTLVQASTVLGSGYWLLTPFCSEDGAIVMVNRGFVPASTPHLTARRAASTACSSAPAGTEVTGLLRMSETGGGFLRDNDARADRWYSRDVQAIADARGLDEVAPYFVDQDAAASPVAGAPVGGLTVISFNNNHLVYALTWFALAAMAGAGCVVFAREGRRTEGPI
jgi:surfeit locus 1 family protein